MSENPLFLAKVPESTEKGLKVRFPNNEWEKSQKMQEKDKKTENEVISNSNFIEENQETQNEFPLNSIDYFVQEVITDLNNLDLTVTESQAEKVFYLKLLGLGQVIVDDIQKTKVYIQLLEIIGKNENKDLTIPVKKLSELSEIKRQLEVIIPYFDNFTSQEYNQLILSNPKELTDYSLNRIDGNIILGEELLSYWENLQKLRLESNYNEENNNIFKISNNQFLLKLIKNTSFSNLLKLMEIKTKFIIIAEAEMQKMLKVTDVQNLEENLKLITGQSSENQNSEELQRQKLEDLFNSNQNTPNTEEGLEKREIDKKLKEEIKTQMQNLEDLFNNIQNNQEQM
jgi:hypothetical protein